MTPDLAAYTERTLLVSTAHVTEATRLSLDGLSPDDAHVSFMAWEYGWSIPTWQIDDDVAEQESLDLIPAEVLAILRFARAHDFQWVRFDSDADALQPFPTFEW